jgi:hypothetical protein
MSQNTPAARKPWGAVTEPGMDLNLIKKMKTGFPGGACRRKNKEERRFLRIAGAGTVCQQLPASLR